MSEVIKINTESYKNLVDARKSLADARKSDMEAAAIREEARHKEIVNAYEEGGLLRRTENISESSSNKTPI